MLNSASCPFVADCKQPETLTPDCDANRTLELDRDAIVAAILFAAPYLRKDWKTHYSRPGPHISNGSASALTVNPDPILIATEAALWGRSRRTASCPTS